MALPNGYHDLPPGKIAAVVTYLEMTEAPLDEVARDVRFTVERVWSPELAWYRALFRRIGEEWLWFGHLKLTDAELWKVLHDPLVEVYALRTGAFDLGMAVLDARTPPDVELMYFGVVREALGQGAGKYLLREAIGRAFARSPRRFWLHTCTNDHPRALEFYRRMGFRAYKRGIEIADDPRLKGILPEDAGPGVPLL